MQTVEEMLTKLKEVAKTSPSAEDTEFKTSAARRVTLGTDDQTKPPSHERKNKME